MKKLAILAAATALTACAQNAPEQVEMVGMANPSQRILRETRWQIRATQRQRRQRIRNVSFTKRSSD